VLNLQQSLAEMMTDKRHFTQCGKARILEHPWMSSARAARESGYSESVARKANRIILGSPRVWRAYERAHRHNNPET
jgi:hypothetical protein